MFVFPYKFCASGMLCAATAFTVRAEGKTHLGYSRLALALSRPSAWLCRNFDDP